MRNLNWAGEISKCEDVVIGPIQCQVHCPQIIVSTKYLFNLDLMKERQKL